VKARSGLPIALGSGAGDGLVGRDADELRGGVKARSGLPIALGAGAGDGLLGRDPDELRGGD
jgi:hypothetical protein